MSNGNGPPPWDRILGMMQNQADALTKLTGQVQVQCDRMERVEKEVDGIVTALYRGNAKDSLLNRVSRVEEKVDDLFGEVSELKKRPPTTPAPSISNLGTGEIAKQPREILGMKPGVAAGVGAILAAVAAMLGKAFDFLLEVARRTLGGP